MHIGIILFVLWAVFGLLILRGAVQQPLDYQYYINRQEDDEAQLEFLKEWREKNNK